MKNNKNPPAWVVKRRMEQRQLGIPFPFYHEVLGNNKLKVQLYGKRND